MNEVKIKECYKRSTECIGNCRPFDSVKRIQYQCKWYDTAYSCCRKNDQDWKARQ